MAEFTAAHPEYLASPNSLSWISSDNGTTYNRCHFWSNFEIGALDFLRSEAYVEYFAHLDRSGGFSYERWGDAPVHSIAAALFLKPEEVHWFHECVLALRSLSLSLPVPRAWGCRTPADAHCAVLRLPRRAVSGTGIPRSSTAQRTAPRGAAATRKTATTSARCLPLPLTRPRPLSRPSLR